MRFTVATATLMFLIGASANLPAQRKVWIVEGTRFSNLQKAVDAARDGDTILVRPGYYTGVTITAKSLVLAVAGARGSVLVPDVKIAKIAATQNVTIRGFDINPALLPPTRPGNLSLTIQDCKGSVLVEDCKAVGSRALTVRDSSSVTLVRCDMFSKINSFSVPSLPLEDVSGSHLQLYDSAFKGGTAPLLSGDGLVVAGLTMFASNCRFVGGNGAQATYYSQFCLTHGGGGGDGLRVSGNATLHGCTFVGGAMGGANWPCLPGPAGVALRGHTDVRAEAGRAPTGEHRGQGNIVVVNRVPRSLVAGSPTREGQVLNISLTGDNGDLAWVVFGLQRRPWLLPGCAGQILPDINVLNLLYVGKLTNGKLSLNPKIPELGKNVDYAELSFQSVILSPQNICALSSPSSALLLDRRF